MSAVVSGRPRVRHRLFWQIYVSFVGVVAVFAGLAALGWLVFDDDRDRSARHEVVAEILSGGLPGAAVHALVIDPDNPGKVYAATDAGVFERTEPGI